VSAEAERSVLSAIIQSPAALREVRALLGAGEFFADQHATIYAACCDLADDGTRVDPVVLLGELERRGVAQKVGGAPFLHTLFAAPAVPSNVAHYAGMVREAAKRRRLTAVGTRLCQIAQDVTDLDDALSLAARESLSLDLLIEETTDGPVEGLASWGEFLGQPDRVADWIIPGLLERQDVVMILSTPGSGKSWLSRQLCLTVAAGVHPFKPAERIEPQRTLLIDLENPPQMVRRQSRPLSSQVARLGSASDLGWVWMRPEGLDLRKHADAQLLERVISETQPSLVALGSLYKAFQRGRDDWDTAAEEVRAVFDRMRSRFRCAFWLEHHMPKGSEHRNPFGSSVWERWPGFGRVIERRGENVFELAKTFRGDRDVREFPAGLYRGGELAWSPIWDADELELLASAGAR
jgi:replicative DNA helicase